MISSSEYCAVGHPDRTCDYISSYILDRYLEQDRRARVALEVQLKDEYCSIVGEVSSGATFDRTTIASFASDAVNQIGYTREYQEQWGQRNIVCGDDIVVSTHISQQSPDIANGVDNDGWGDQGIFVGLAVNDPTTNYLSYDYWLAREIGQKLYDQRLGGLDIKTLVTVEDGHPIDCVIAIPLLSDMSREPIEKLAVETLGEGCNIIINGTGRYERHGSIGDSGTTGRKLAVDFYGGACRIGGGSPWGKDPSKSDVTLNIYARIKALEYMKRHDVGLVTCSIACCIGRPEIRISYFDAGNKFLDTEVETRKPCDVISELGLYYPGYADRCKQGLFGYEDIESIGA